MTSKNRWQQRYTFKKKTYWGYGEAVGRLFHSIVWWRAWQDVFLPLFSILYHVCIWVCSFQGPHFSHVHSGTSWLNFSDINRCRVAGRMEAHSLSGENEVYHEKLQRSTTAWVPPQSPKAASSFGWGAMGQAQNKKFCLPGRWPLSCLPNGLQGQPWMQLAAVFWSGS